MEKGVKSSVIGMYRIVQFMVLAEMSGTNTLVAGKAMSVLEHTTADMEGASFKSPYILKANHQLNRISSQLCTLL
jgi:hypothetical protein